MAQHATVSLQRLAWPVDSLLPVIHKRICVLCHVFRACGDSHHPTTTRLVLQSAHTHVCVAPLKRHRARAMCVLGVLTSKALHHVVEVDMGQPHAQIKLQCVQQHALTFHNVATVLQEELHNRRTERRRARGSEWFVAGLDAVCGRRQTSSSVRSCCFGFRSMQYSLVTVCSFLGASVTLLASSTHAAAVS